MKQVRQIKVVGAGLNGFVDLVDPISSELAEEREDDMSSLATRFSARMCKRAMSAQGETTPSSKASGGKRPKRYGPNDEA